MTNTGWARAPLVWLLALALIGVVMLWRLPESRSPSGRPPVPAPGPEAPPAVPVPEPLVPAERLPARGAEPRAPLRELGGRLRVRVIAAGGVRFDDLARVEVRDAAGTRVAALEFSAADPSAELDCAPGEYELTLEPTGSQRLGAFPERVVLKAGAEETVTFTLADMRSLRGRLTDERELGIEDVRIALEREKRVVSEVRTRADGSFVFGPLPEGDYALVVGDPLGPLVPRRLLRLDEELGEQELRVPVLLELEVRVLDESGLPVDGAEVEGVGEQGGRVAGVTDVDGKLRAMLLPPGNYRIFARHPTLGRGNRILALTSESAPALEIRLLTARKRR